VERVLHILVGNIMNAQLLCSVRFFVPIIRRGEHYYEVLLNVISPEPWVGFTWIMQILYVSNISVIKGAG
jgi:hypothetical protein